MSHFSFTRNLYDKCALEKKDQESTSPFQWVTDSQVTESKMSCHQGASPFMQNPFKSIPINKVDIESDLRGQNYMNSRCPTHKYNPELQKTYNETLKNCEKNVEFIPEYTRLNKACNIFNGISINRFSPLCDDVQALNKIHSNNYIGTNTRLQVKDAIKDNKKYSNSMNFIKDPYTPCKTQGQYCSYLIPK